MDINGVHDCQEDSVSVFNGNDGNAPLIGRYCDTTVPSAITSAGSHLYIRFVSLSSGSQRTGFRAVYTKDDSSMYGDVSLLVLSVVTNFQLIDELGCFNVDRLWWSFQWITK